MEIKKQLSILKRGTVEIISEESLIKKLEKSKRNKKPLRVKAGFDPTAPDIHLGHTVLLNKLRQFQDLGHVVYFLIGDFTGMIGDPSGKNEIRKRLTLSEVKKNAITYKRQVFKILNPKRTKVVFNSRWLKKLDSLKLLNLSSHITVAQMLARADFSQRYSQGKDISLLEFFYPLLQAYDSVYLKADIELGGTDQKFNLLLGRELQKDFSLEEQVVMMLPLLEGTDGINKMSKSLDNYIGINEPANEMFGKIMSITDELMLRYFELLTVEDLKSVKQLHPREAKVNLAQLIVERFYNKLAADQARENFEKIFSQKGVPSDLESYKLVNNEIILELLVNTKLVKSKNEARRLIKQQAVSLDSLKITSEDTVIDKSGILKVGSRRFIKLTE